MIRTLASLKLIGSYTSSQDLTLPTNVRRITGFGSGGGGGGGGAANNSGALGGGGAGSKPQPFSIPIDSSATYAVEIGTGGTGGDGAGSSGGTVTDGTAGGNSYIRKKKTVTLTIASPCVVTLASHGLKFGQRVKFSTTGALPTGITAGTEYFAVPVDTNTFQISSGSSAGYAAVNTSGSQSGVHTISIVEVTFYGAPGGTGGVNSGPTQGIGGGTTWSSQAHLFSPGGTPTASFPSTTPDARWGGDSQFARGGFQVDNGGQQSGGGGGAGFGPGGIAYNNTDGSSAGDMNGTDGGGGAGGGRASSFGYGGADGGNGRIDIYAVVS